jgi:folate-binding protein YgfZ
LLSPQGKVLFEFFVATAPTGYLLDVARDQIAGLIKRLAMYRLRARVDIRDASPEYRVFAVWGGPRLQPLGSAGTVSFIDPRLADLGLRVLARTASAHDAPPAIDGAAATPEDYHAHRIALGVPEAGRDYPPGETFAHEANLDALKSVSFTKGCFVGQEVASRIEHRGTARTRTAIVESERPPLPGGKIMAGAAAIGTVGSVAGRRGLALVRLDRVQEAESKGEPLTLADGRVTIRRPEYLSPAGAKAHDRR